MTPADLMELGLKLFPITPRKRPMMTGWQRYAMGATLDDIRNHWRMGVRAFGIYLAPSRLVAIDADNEQADQWADATLPDTPMMTLTKRGAHRFYRLAENQPAPRDNRPIAGLSLDRKAKGYVVAPGSVIGGFVYKEVSFWDTPLCDLPRYPADKFPAEREARKCEVNTSDIPFGKDAAIIAKWFIDNCEDSVQGENGSRMLKRAASFFVNGMALGMDNAEACMFEWNTHRAKPMWSAKEIRHALETSLREGAANGRPRGWAYGEWARR